MLPGRLKQLAAGVAAVAAIAVLGWQIRVQTASPDPGAVVRDFFVDEETLAFERHTVREVPPLAGRDGKPSVVIARCFSGDQGRIIGWLERYPPEVKATMEELMAAESPDPWALVKASAAKEVRRPEAGSPWVAGASPEGKAICVPPRRGDGSSASPTMPAD